MGATSVTGVSGPGSAASPGAGMKGSQNISLGVANLIGPRVVVCGDLTLDGAGVGTAYYPTLPGTAEMYCVVLGNGTSNHVYYGNFTLSSFGVSGGGDSEGVCYAIIKKGIFGSPTTDLGNT